MKTFLPVFLLSFFLFSFTTSNAQTVDEIIAQYVKAMDGKEKLQTLKTVKMTGSMNVQGADIAIVFSKSHLVGSRMDIEVMGTSNFQYLNSNSGKVFMPIMGMAAPQDMEPGELQTSITQLDIQGPLLDYKEKGNTVVLKGKEKLENGEAYNLLVTFKKGKTVNYYIDGTTYRIAKITSVENVQGSDNAVEFSYGDYKQNADGYWFPYSLTNSRGTILFDKIETNVPIDEKIFSN